MFQLSLDNGAGAVIQPGSVTLPVGNRIGENNVSLVIPVNSIPGIICSQSGDSSDIAVWLTMQVSDTPATSPSWYAPTLPDLQGRISAPELEVYTNSILQQGQPDSVSSIITETVNVIRGYIARGGFRMGAAGTLPREVVHIALDIAKETLFKRTASLNGFSETMRLICADSRKVLEQIAEGKFAVSTPEVGTEDDTMQTAAQVEIARPSLRRQFSRARLDGLQ
jgi:hypothetical protein